MIKVGDQVIITKISNIDKRAGVTADKICIVTSMSSRMYNLSPVGNPQKEWVLFHDQVRKF